MNTHRPARRSRQALRLQRSALALLAACGSASATQAATPASNSKLDQVVVTASRLPQRLGDVLADLTVIDRAQIERQALGSVADLLRSHGCAEMTRNGNPASTTSILLRGADNRHTVVLLDGVRIDSQATGGASWQAIPLAQVERVEVLKGPASAIYGSDAVGGVVQIITRKGTSGAPRIELGAAVGNLSSYKLDGSVSGGIGERFDYALSLAGERSKGFDATTPQSRFSHVPDRDGWESYSGNLRLGAGIAAGHRLELVALASRADSQYDDSAFELQADDHSIQDNRALRAVWQAQWSPALRTELSLGEGQDRYETQHYDSVAPFPYLTETRIRSAALLGSYEFSKGNQVNFQLERREDKLENSGLRANDKQAERSQNALALGWLYQAQQFDLQVQARRDDDSEFGGINTGTLAAGYKLSQALRIYASVGKAFRAPTLYQSYSEYGPNLILPGVQPLNPERGRNAEVGLRYDAGGFDISATAYRNKVKDLIVFDQPGICDSTFGCYRNVARARLQGLNLAASTLLGSVRLSGTLDLQSPKDQDSGKLLRRRAETYGTLRAETSAGAWHLGAGLQASGKRWDDARNTVKLGGYALANFDVQYKLNPQLRLQLNLDNAFDRDYQTAYGYNSMPRTVFLGLRYTPKL